MEFHLLAVVGLITGDRVVGVVRCGGGQRETGSDLLLGLDLGLEGRGVWGAAGERAIG